VTSEAPKTNPPDKLRRAVEAAIKRYGGVRPAARVLKVDAGYLVRLRNGDKCNPSDALLRKLKLRRVVTYEFL